MPGFGVSEQKEVELRARMAACGLREADIEEQFVTTGGPGGQKAARSATGVRLTHRPTGLQVKMRKARSQALNRFYARRRLCESIEARNAEGTARKTPADIQREKVRKQKKRRQRRSRQSD